ncbi:hypothetical protein APSETT444_007587 [Aspergillus pseudonomiae]
MSLLDKFYDARRLSRTYEEGFRTLTSIGVTLANKPHPIGTNWLNDGRLVICAVDWTNLWPLHLGPAASGSGRDIQWVLQKAWDDDPTKDLAPWYLFDPAVVLEIRTTEKLKDARQEVEVMLGR